MLLQLWRRFSISSLRALRPAFFLLIAVCVCFSEGPITALAHGLLPGMGSEKPQYKAHSMSSLSGSVNDTGQYYPLFSADVPWNGGPVQHNPTSYAIFWGPTWTNGNPDYGNAIRVLDYFYFLRGSQFANILTQYYDNSGYINNDHQFIAAAFDPNPPPTVGNCGPNTVDDSFVQQEVSAIRSQQGWTATTDATYYVYVPPGDPVWTSDLGCSNGANSSKVFCGYHGLSTWDWPQEYDYATLVYPDQASLCNETGGTTSDQLVSRTSHEQFESITDPQSPSGWYDQQSADPNDSSDREIGDRCNYKGETITLTGGYSFIMQAEYSDATHLCDTQYPLNTSCTAPASLAPTVTLNATTLTAFGTGAIDSTSWISSYQRQLPYTGWATSYVGNANGAFIEGSPNSHLGLSAGSKLVYAVGADGHLYDYYSSGSGWGGPNNLLPPSGVSFICSPSTLAYTAPGSSAAHDIAFVLGNDGNLYSYEWVQGGGWTRTRISSSGIFVNSPNSHLGLSAGSKLVYAVGADGHLYDYYSSGSGWGGPNNLLPPSGVSFVGSPTSFAYTAPGSSAAHDIAFVLGNDGNLYSYEWVQGGGWTRTRISSSGIFVNSPSGHPGTTAGSKYVYAVGKDGYLYDYFWTGSSWGGPNKLPPPPNVEFINSPATFAYTESGSSLAHDIAFVQGNDGNLYSYEWVQGGGWTMTDLGKAANDAKLAPNGAPSAIAG